MKNNGNRFWQFIALKIFGWRVEGKIPTEDKYLCVVLPHTSNWDFVVGYMLKLAYGLNLSIFAKDNFFVWPISWFCKKLGVYPVNRRDRTNLVDQIVSLINAEKKISVVITPEGTRGLRSKLKSGYYHIAKKADIHIVLVGIDFKDKTIYVADSRKVMPTFDEDADALIAYIKTINAKNPELTFPK